MSELADTIASESAERVLRRNKLIIKLVPVRFNINSFHHELSRTFALPGSGLHVRQLKIKVNRSNDRVCFDNSQAEDDMLSMKNNIEAYFPQLGFKFCPNFTTLQRQKAYYQYKKYYLTLCPNSGFL